MLDGSSEEERRALLVRVVCVGCALASVPIAAMSMRGYGLDAWPQVAVPALVPTITTGLVALWCARRVLRAGSSALVLFLGPLFGLLNMCVMASSFAALEGGLGAAGGAFLLSLMFGFPLGLVVGLAFALALWPLFWLERRLRGREDVDAGLVFGAGAAAWALVMGIATYVLEAVSPSLALWSGGPVGVGLVALAGAAIFVGVIGARYLRVGRLIRRVAAGHEPGMRLVAPSAEDDAAERSARFGRAEWVLVREERTGEGPFREVAAQEALMGLPSMRTLARRVAWLALLAIGSVGVLAGTSAAVDARTQVMVEVARSDSDW